MAQAQVSDFKSQALNILILKALILGSKHITGKITEARNNFSDIRVSKLQTTNALMPQKIVNACSQSQTNA